LRRIIADLTDSRCSIEYDNAVSVTKNVQLAGALDRQHMSIDGELRGPNSTPTQSGPPGYIST